MKIKQLTAFIVLTLVVSGCSFLKEKNENKPSLVKEEIRGDYRIMFYNAENLFDTFDDPEKRDDEFLPEGKKYWSKSKFYTKINNVAKVITGIGGWSPPEIVGLCEIENRFCVESIVKYSPLKKFNYQIVHKESPDRRGIDVALLYLKNRFTLISKEFIQVDFPNSDSKTRDILYVKGKTKNEDTLHVFVNHWPSRWGGMMESEERRMFVASLVRAKADSIFKADAVPKIIIMGDLNDYPENKSMMEVLRAKTEYDNPNPKELYNLAWYMQNKKGMGSHKYQGEWGVLDQIVLSGGLLKQNNKLYTSIDNAKTWNQPFLLEKDVQHVGYKPFRTYIGYKYNGGFSDHLPVYLDLFDADKQQAKN